MRGRGKRPAPSGASAGTAMQKRLRACCLGIALLLPALCLADTLEADVRAVLSQTRPRPFSGVVLVTRGDEAPVVVAHGVSADARFVIGSLSKQMTAALVLRAVERGQIDLDAPLRAALPQLQEDWAAQVTVRQLLNHTSGVEARGKPLRATPGTAFSYSNGGYDLLGEVLLAASQAPLTKQFAAMFAQCHMRDAGVAGDAGREPVAGFTETDDARFVPASPTTQVAYAASGGVVADVTDLLRWTHCLYGTWLLSEASLSAMTRPDAKREHRWGALGYGYGLQIADTPLGVEYSHSGYVPGYQSMLIYYPADRTTLVVLENISWNTDDTGRAFYFHDALRRL